MLAPNHLLMTWIRVFKTQDVTIKWDTTVLAKSQRFSLLLSKLFALIHCALHLTTLCSTMSSEADQASNIADNNPTAGSQSAIVVGSNAASSTPSSTIVDQAMARKENPPLYQYLSWCMTMI
jgi:hypothetical protein